MLESDSYSQMLTDLRWRIASTQLDVKLLKLRLALKYDPAQPREPAGTPEGGRWTSGGGRTQLAQNLPRGPRGPRFFGGGAEEPTPAQAARLELSNMRAEQALQRVREVDPNWRPQPSLHEGIEGRIAANEAAAQQADAHYRDLQRNGVVPGPFADESIPARGPERSFTADERRERNNIGSDAGCHTCGTTDAGTIRNNFVPDHQPPNALNQSGGLQRLYPQCLTCSLRQGSWITNHPRTSE
jgi:hypothetical protein